MKRRASILATLLLAVLGAAALAWLAAGEQIRAASWDRVVLRPPGEADLEAAQSCGDLGWSAALRLIGADRDVPCGETRLSLRLAHLLEKHPYRRRWAAARAEAGHATPERLRWAVALHRVGEPPASLARLSRTRRVPPERLGAWTAELAALDELPVWADPALRTAIAMFRLETSDAVTVADVRAARRAQLGLPGLRILPYRMASNTLGLDLGRVWSDRARGAPLGWVPMAAMRTLGRRIDECTVPEDPRCLDLVLDLAEADLSEDGPDRPDAAPPPGSAASVLWEILYSDPEIRRLADAELADWRAWLAANGPRALHAALLEGRTAEHELQLARAGDPLAALQLGGSTPWATALAATLIAEGAQVGETAQGAALTVHGQTWLLPRCGSFAGAPAEYQAPTPLSHDGILARAALELAAAESRAGRRVRAHQAAALAVRIDPAGRPAAPGIDAMLPPALDAATNAGRQAGSLLAAAPDSTDALEPGELRDPCR